MRITDFNLSYISTTYIIIQNMKMSSPPLLSEKLKVDADFGSSGKK
jgi:hypothetical protein